MNKKTILFSIIVLCLCNCTFFKLITSAKINAPTFTFDSYKVKDVNENRTTVDFILSSYNPNKIGLKNITISYELFAENKRFLKGNDIRIDLKPEDTTRIIIPAEINYRDVYDAVGVVSKKIMQNKKSIPVRIDAVIAGDPTVYDKTEAGSLFNATLKLSKTVDVPIANLEDKAKKSVEKAAVKELESILK